MSERTDSERLDWLERAVLEDDAMLSAYGEDPGPDTCAIDIEGEKVGKARSLRAAIDAAMDAREGPDGKPCQCGGEPCIGAATLRSGYRCAQAGGGR